MIKDLQELIKNKRERCYWSFGMTDIDLFKMSNQFVVDESILPGQHTFFILSNNEFNKLYKQLKSV